MTGFGLFVVAILALFLTAIGFFIPPIWLNAGDTLTNNTKIAATCGLVLLFAILCVGSYAGLGVSRQLADFYNPDNVAMRQSAARVRPLYARLSRELVKLDLNIALDLHNADLILKFAQLQSETQQGLLSSDAEKLLTALLVAVPKQATALNLLAINAYKKHEYGRAVELWQAILEQFPADLVTSPAAVILRDKIRETQAKLENIKTTAQN